jgi:hypothetical protein
MSEDLLRALRIAAIRFESLARMGADNLVLKNCAEAAARDIREAMDRLNEPEKKNSEDWASSNFPYWTEG